MEYLVEIGYKSGNKVEDGERTINYEFADPERRMVFFGLDDIEYIFQKDVRNENG